MNIGWFYALLAYLIWGLFPAYWKPLKAIPATQLIAHRIAWSFVFMFGVLMALRQMTRLHTLLRVRRTVCIYAFAALLLAANWLTYVWGVNHGHVVEASLGYFINPLLSVVLGLVVLKEELRLYQWLAIGLATAGVLYLTLAYGRLPWIALALAGTFATYGLITKTAPLDAIDGLTLETGLLFLPAVGFLAWQETQGKGAFGHVNALHNAMLIGAGAATAVPLLAFGAAARRIPLSVLGILQYLSPTLQFLLGVLAYHESFTRVHLLGYGLVWIGVAIFLWESWHHHIRALPASQIPTLE